MGLEGSSQYWGQSWDENSKFRRFLAYKTKTGPASGELPGVTCRKDSRIPFEINKTAEQIWSIKSFLSLGLWLRVQKKTLDILRIIKNALSFSLAFPEDGKITSWVILPTFDNIVIIFFCEWSILPFYHFPGSWVTFFTLGMYGVVVY